MRWYYSLRWLILILLGLALYGQTFGFDFIFDDFQFIVNNPCITRFDYVHYIWNSYPPTRTAGFYSFALNYFFGQLHPQGYHILNFMIHLLATGLVWATATLLFKLAGCALEELPFFIAVIFLVHPCQTQAVSYISQRFESLATVFYLSSIYFYLRGRMTLITKNKKFLFAASLISAILGILTKETAITIPVMILAIEFIFFKKPPLKSKKPQASQPYLLITILGIIFALLFIKLVRTNFISTYFHFYAPSDSHDGDIITGSKYVLTQARVFLTFLRLLILPINQNLDYDYPLSTGLLSPPLTLVGFGLIGFIISMIIKLRKQWPLIAFGLAWIVITFSINTAPRINVIFEHKLYLISFGFFLALVCALSTMIKDRKTLYGSLIILIAVLSLVTYKRNQVWKNELTLWEDVIIKSPHKARPHYNRGSIYFQQGNFTKAIPDFNEAIQLNPNYIAAYVNLGIIYDTDGNFPQAMSNYNKVIEIDPYLQEAYYNRGVCYSHQGNLTKALLDYSQTIAIDPHSTKAYYNRAVTYFQLKEYAKALEDAYKVKSLGGSVDPGFLEELKKH